MAADKIRMREALSIEIQRLHFLEVTFQLLNIQACPRIPRNKICVECRNNDPEMRNKKESK